MSFCLSFLTVLCRKQDNPKLQLPHHCKNGSNKRQPSHRLNNSSSSRKPLQPPQQHNQPTSTAAGSLATKPS